MERAKTKEKKMNKDWGEMDHHFSLKSDPILLEDVILMYDLNCMFYADDSQVYVSTSLTTQTMMLSILFGDVLSKFSHGTVMLKRNPGKTGVLHFTL